MVIVVVVVNSGGGSKNIYTTLPFTYFVFQAIDTIDQTYILSSYTT